MLFLITLFLNFSFFSNADFGEIDLMVRESIAQYFEKQGIEIDTNTFKYKSDLELVDAAEDLYVVQTTLNDAPDSVSFFCTTEIKILNPGKYRIVSIQCGEI